jgi:hypothetical protein
MLIPSTQGVALMVISDSDELHAKAIIAAALIQSNAIGLNYNESELRKPWVDHEALMRLNKLTHRVFEAISSSPSRDSM